MTTIYNNHSYFIDRDNQLAIRGWNRADFFSSGMFTGRIEKIILDNAPKSERNQRAPELFMEGWHVGLSGVYEEHFLDQCFVQNTELTDTLYDAMEAYINNDPVTGDQKMAATRPLFTTALAACTQPDYTTKSTYDKSFAKWAKEFDDLQARPDWDQLSKKIYEDEKFVIDRFVGAEFDAWKEGDFAKAGFMAG